MDRAQILPGPAPNNRLYSECSKLHPNRFTFGGVIAERVNTAKSPRKVNLIFDRSYSFEPNSNIIYYPHMPISKMWIYRLLLFVCLFACLYVWGFLHRWWSLAASNIARWFIGVLGRKSPSLENFAPSEAQNRTNRQRVIYSRWAAMARATRACAWTTRRIGICG